MSFTTKNLNQKINYADKNLIIGLGSSSKGIISKMRQKITNFDSLMSTWLVLSSVEDKQLSLSAGFREDEICVSFVPEHGPGAGGDPVRGLENFERGLAETTSAKAILSEILAKNEFQNIFVVGSMEGGTFTGGLAGVWQVIKNAEAIDAKYSAQEGGYELHSNHISPKKLRVPFFICEIPRDEGRPRTRSLDQLNKLMLDGCPVLALDYQKVKPLDGSPMSYLEDELDSYAINSIMAVINSVSLPGVAGKIDISDYHRRVKNGGKFSAYQGRGRDLATALSELKSKNYNHEDWALPITDGILIIASPDGITSLADDVSVDQVLTNAGLRNADKSDDDIKKQFVKSSSGDYQVMFFGICGDSQNGESEIQTIEVKKDLSNHNQVVTFEASIPDSESGIIAKAFADAGVVMIKEGRAYSAHLKNSSNIAGNKNLNAGEKMVLLSLV
jgi:hypothetical protein